MDTHVGDFWATRLTWFSAAGHCAIISPEVFRLGVHECLRQMASSAAGSSFAHSQSTRWTVSLCIRKTISSIRLDNTIVVRYIEVAELLFHFVITAIWSTDLWDTWISAKRIIERVIFVEILCDNELNVSSTFEQSVKENENNSAKECMNVSVGQALYSNNRFV